MHPFIQRAGNVLIEHVLGESCITQLQGNRGLSKGKKKK